MNDLKKMTKKQLVKTLQEKLDQLNLIQKNYKKLDKKCKDLTVKKQKFNQLQQISQKFIKQLEELKSLSANKDLALKICQKKTQKFNTQISNHAQNSKKLRLQIQQLQNSHTSQIQSLQNNNKVQIQKKQTQIQQLQNNHKVQLQKKQIQIQQLQNSHKGQIQILQNNNTNQINSINEQLNQKNSQISKLQHELNSTSTDAKSNIATFQQQLNQLKEQLKNKTTEFENLQKKSAELQIKVGIYEKQKIKIDAYALILEILKQQQLVSNGKLEYKNIIDLFKTQSVPQDKVLEYKARGFDLNHEIEQSQNRINQFKLDILRIYQRYNKVANK